MARVRQTDIAVLGALSVEPMTGYQVRSAITEVLGHFWHESFGQIYPSLARLETDGFIAATQGSRTASRVFTLTTAGQAELARLLEMPPEPQQPRNALLLRIFFGANLPPEVMSGLLDDYETRLRVTMDGYRAIRAEIAGDPAAGKHRPYWLATVSSGELTVRAQLEWVEQTRATLLHE